MTEKAGQISAMASAKALWRRAPLWRLFALLAVLLTLVFLLFPPLVPQQAAGRSAPKADTVANTDTATNTDRGTYTPPRVASSTNTLPPAHLDHPDAPSGQSTQSAANPPRTAILSMVRAARRREDGTGLDEALIGPLYTNSVPVDGYAVPLPPGEWASLAHAVLSQATATGDAHFLGRIRNKRLIGAIRIFAARSKSQPGEGFPEVKSCTEPNPGRTYVAIDDEMIPKGHQACWTIRNVYATPWQRWADKAEKISGLDRAAAGDMMAKGVTYPQDFVALTFTRTESWGLLEVMYLFSPETEGISSNTALSVRETDWTAANITRYPEKLAYVEKLKTWVVRFWPRFKAAFDKGETPPGT